MKHHIATLAERREIGPDLFSLWLRFPHSIDVKPGQFFEFRTGETFLRRALSVADQDAERLRFVLRAVGPGTSWLASQTVGVELDLFGPLGQGVDAANQKPVMLLAGGVGAAPLLFLSRVLKEQNIDCIALLAAGTENEIILADEFRLLCKEVIFCTDDGSCGRKGLLTDVLPRLPQINEVKIFYACGPEPMFGALKRLGLNKPIHAFLESRMGCGTGLCVGCAVKGVDGLYHRVCLEGPVFPLEEIEV